MKRVETSSENGVMTITLVDVERRNALSDQLIGELIDAIDALESDPTMRVAVLTNRGGVFCAGANLAERVSDQSRSAGRSASLSEVFTRIQNSPIPFLGRIAGHCVAGGVGLAAVMDISIAIETASFGFSEVRLGVAPAMISVVCLPKMRQADARSTFLRGNRFAAVEAARMGLVNMAVPAERLDEEVTAAVNDLLCGEPHAIAVAKELTWKVPSMAVHEAFAWTTALSADLFASAPARDGMRAFLKKRAAPWVQHVEDTPGDHQ